MFLQIIIKDIENEKVRCVFKTVLSSGYILILLSIEYILASLIEMCQGQSRHAQCEVTPYIGRHFVDSKTTKAEQ